MTIRVNVNGRIGAPDEPMISPLDQGFLFGYSVYETVRTYGGEPFAVPRHLRRLRESAEALAIPHHVDDETLERWIRDTLAAAGNDESSVRIVVSAGVGSIDYKKGSTPRATVVIIVRPLPSYPERLYREGEKAAIVSERRATTGGLSPSIKSSNLLNNLMALRSAQARGAYEALMKNDAGDVTEGSMSNVFLVEAGVVYTPPVSAGILEGITREHVLSLAAGAGIELREESFPPERLLAADEVFITASSRQIVPIVTVDDTTIGDGTPGPVTRRLISLYDAHVRALVEAHASDRPRNEGKA